MAYSYSELKNQVGDHIVGQVLDMKAAQDKALADIRFKIAVISGKGGVGKSATTASLAKALCRLGASVAVLDADLNGPSQGAMLGLDEAAIRQQNAITPARSGKIRYLGMDAFLQDPHQPLVWQNEGGLAEDSFVWRGLQEARVLQSMLRDTTWGKQDFLLVDLPPGTGRIEEFTQILPELDGLIIVGIPSPVAGQVVARSLALTRRLKLGTLGLIENMARVSCPHCQGESPLFHTKGGLEELAAHYQIPFLGSVPFEHHFMEVLDNGQDPFENPGPAALALSRIAQNLHDILLKGILPT